MNFVYDHPVLTIAAILLIVFLFVFFCWSNKMQNEHSKEDEEALAELAEIEMREKYLAIEKQRQSIKAFLGPCEGCRDYEHRCCG